MSQVEEKCPQCSSTERTIRHVQGYLNDPRTPLQSRPIYCANLWHGIASHVPDGATQKVSMEQALDRIRIRSDISSTQAMSLAYIAGWNASRTEPRHFVCIGCKCGPHAFVDQHSPKIAVGGVAAEWEQNKAGTALDLKGEAGLMTPPLSNEPTATVVDQHAPKENMTADEWDKLHPNRDWRDDGPSMAGADPDAEALWNAICANENHEFNMASKEACIAFAEAYASSLRQQVAQATRDLEDCHAAASRLRARAEAAEKALAEREGK